MDIYSDRIDSCDGEVIDIVNYILDFCNGSKDFVNYLYNIEITISDEEITKKYSGKYTDQKIIEILNRTLLTSERCNDLIDSLKKVLSKPINERHESAIKELLGALKGMLDGNLSKADIKKIKKIIDVFNNSAHEDVILGIYSNKKITLYRKPIIDTSINGDVQSNLKRVLLHEMFHAYHHYYINGGKGRFGDNSKGKAEVVVEGLARFVEYNYCEEKLGGLYCQRLEESWNRYFFEEYPYSAAKYLYEFSKNNRYRRKAITNSLLIDSASSFTDAYHNIVYLYKELTGFDLIHRNYKYNCNILY